VAFDDYRVREHWRLNCVGWNGRRAQHEQQSQAERNRERDAQAWRYARQHRVSYSEACRQLFDTDED
jgi:hypothetical protein